MWELPAGSVDAGETPEDAARRECHEEIGQVPDDDRAARGALPDTRLLRRGDGVLPAVRSDAADDAAHVDEDEDIEVARVRAGRRARDGPPRRDHRHEDDGGPRDALETMRIIYTQGYELDLGGHVWPTARYR